VDPSGPVTSLLQKLRLSRLFPGLAIQTTGHATTCTSEHIGIWFSGMVEHEVARHLHVTLNVHTRGSERVAVLGVTEPKVGDQKLVEGAPVGGEGVKPLTLEPGGVPVEAYFELQAADGADVDAQPGDDVRFRLRIGKLGRAPLVKVPIQASR
jgi:hypothetical protein